MPSEGSKFVTHRRESPLTFGTRKSAVFMGSTSLDHVVDVTATVVNMFYFCKQANHIEENTFEQ